MNIGPEPYRVIATCLTCEKQFKAKRKCRKFCSSYCRNHIQSIAYKERNDPPKHPLLRTKGVKPRRGVVRECGYCHAELYVLPCNVRGSTHSFCSHEHWKLWKQATKREICVPCQICTTSICTNPSTARLRPRVTCSKPCLKAYKRKQAEVRRKTYTKHQIDRLARYSREAEEWRKAVFARDDYTCQFCGVRGTYLEADHIKPWAYFPDLRFELSNGRTLCKPCHNTTKMSATTMRKLYGTSSTG